VALIKFSFEVLPVVNHTAQQYPTIG